MVQAQSKVIAEAREQPLPHWDPMQVRADFPILGRLIHGKCLVYLDNAATTQKPQAVIDALCQFYQMDYANIHRGVYYLSELATEAYEGARSRVQKFIHAKSPHEVVFTRGTTESINLVAQTFGRTYLKKGDEVLLSGMEHHSNIVPWQILRDEIGIVLKVIPFSDAGEISLADVDRLLGPKTRLVAVVHASNVLGTINPIRELVDRAHARNIPLLVDGAQAAPHLPIDVQELDCDFYAFSGHKLYGPTGIGVLYAKEKWLQEMPPYQGGGDMIQSVTFEKTLYKKPPHRFEAGTPHIAGAIGLTAAMNYVEAIGLETIVRYEQSLLHYATEVLQEIPGLRLIGTAQRKTSLISFTLDRVHPHDVGTVLDQQGIAIRAGHHCAQPVMERYGIPATVRASFAFYNLREEIDALAGGLKKAVEVFR